MGLSISAVMVHPMEEAHRSKVARSWFTSSASLSYWYVLCLLFELIRLARQNPVAIEEHIEAPDDSTIFSNYPKILKDKEAIALICDTLRSASMNYDDPHQVEEVLDKRCRADIGQRCRAGGR